MSELDGSRVMKKLPIATRVISVISFGSTIIAIVGGLSLLWRGTILDRLWKLNPVAQTDRICADQGLVVGLLLLCLGIMSSVVGIGLLKGKTWAWWLTLLLLVAVGGVNLLRLRPD